MLRISIHIFSSLLLLNYHYSEGEHPLNFTNLMKKYFLLCGQDYFCRSPHETHKSEYVPDLQYTDQNVCPPCKCTKDCVTTGDCCPDLFFSLPEMTCVSRTILWGTKKKEKAYLHLMVGKCPVESDVSLMEKCEKFNDTFFRLMYLPVTGNAQPITFKNKFCAECHDVTDYRPWYLDIECDEVADLNYISSVDELVSQAHNKGCIFQANDRHEKNSSYNQANCLDRSSETSFEKCNETGLWGTYDPDIRYACESEYTNHFRVFKNVFCYMCNPSKHGDLEYVDECNITKAWRPYDGGLHKACLNNDATTSTFPFKNIFCFFCNRNNNNREIFIDVKTNITESIKLMNNTNELVYTYLITTDINMEYFRESIESLIRHDDTVSVNEVDVRNFHSGFFENPEGVNINITNLLQQYASLTIAEKKSTDVCPSRTRSEIIRNSTNNNCNCDPFCAFNSSNCCLDAMLELPVTCLKMESLSSSNGEGRADNAMPVVNGCLQKYSNVISKRACGIRNKNDIYSYLPLSYMNNIPFFNLYCALCNMESDNYIDEMRGNPARSNDSSEIDDRTMNYFLSLFEHNLAKYAFWEMYIFCNDYIDFSHYLFLQDYMKSTEKLNCTIRFENNLPKDLMHNCIPRVISSQNVHKCSEIQRWSFADSDVEWACNKAIMLPQFYKPGVKYFVTGHIRFQSYNSYRQEMSPFGNAFCYLCKPSGHWYNDDAIIDECHDTAPLGLKSLALAKNCKDHPLIYYFSPFKNRACALCNGVQLLPIAIRITQEDLVATVTILNVTKYKDRELSILTLVTTFKVFTESEVSVTTCSRGQLLDLHTVLVAISFFLFSAPELKDTVHYCDHAWSVVRPSPVVNFSHFRLLH